MKRRDSTKKSPKRTSGRDALSWLSQDGVDFASNHFEGVENALSFVRALCKAGAKVTIPKLIYPDYADTLHVLIPRAREGAIWKIIALHGGADELHEKAGGVWRLWWD